MRVTEAIKALSVDAKRAYVEQWTAEVGQPKSYSPEKADFKDPIEKVKFTTWLRALISKNEPPAGEFEAWREKRKQERGERMAA